MAAVEFLNGNGWLQFVAFLVKTCIFLFLFIWLRGTLPRFRYDQFMRLGWKALVPLSLLWILVVFALRTYRTIGGGDVTVGCSRSASCRGRRAGGRVPRAGPAAARGAGGRAGVRLPGAPAGPRGPRPVRPRRRAVEEAPTRPPRGSRATAAAGTVAREPAQHRLLDQGRASKCSTSSRASASPSRRCSRRWSPRSTPRTSSRPRRATTAATSSTGTRTGWRSASAASCAPGPARPTPSTSRVATTPTRRATPRVSGTARSTRSTTSGASAAACASRPARPAR